MKNIFFTIFFIIVFTACKEPIKEKAEPIIVEKPIIKKEFGFNIASYTVIKDTVRKEETFGLILEKNHISNKRIYEIVSKTKNTFDIARNLRVGKPYTILAKKDSTKQAQIFIYQPNKIDYVVFNFKDSIQSYNAKKTVKTVIKNISGKIESSLSNAIEDQGVNYKLTYALSDIYAWTIDFYHLQKNDKFKIIYEERFIEDTIPVGIGNIKAAYFEHRGKPLYSFRYLIDSTKNISEYFDEKSNNLRRTFLKAPLKFSSRISSRYNLKRRIKHYNYKIKPHKGTDFPSPIGTPIIATANGTVTESEKRGGNGNYVKIKHNGTYSTQYLHMKKRKVKVGDFVQQGDVIGWIGMTGSTGGPHVCYRFWKNGKQVDPFKQKLEAAKPMEEKVKIPYYNYIKPLKKELDNISFAKEEALIEEKDSLNVTH